jgi:hypothetical protein
VLFVTLVVEVLFLFRFRLSLANAENLIELIDDLLGLRAVGGWIHERKLFHEQILQPAAMLDPFTDAESGNLRQSRLAFLRQNPISE